MTNLQTIEIVKFVVTPKSVKLIFISLPVRAYCDATAPHLPVEEMGIQVE